MILRRCWCLFMWLMMLTSTTRLFDSFWLWTTTPRPLLPPSWGGGRRKRGGNVDFLVVFRYDAVGTCPALALRCLVLRCSASWPVCTRRTAPRSSSFLAIACAMLVWLVTIHFASCSFLASPGPGCSAWPLWTRRTVLFVRSSSTTVACARLVFLVILHLALYFLTSCRQAQMLGIPAGMDQMYIYAAKWWPRSSPTTAVACFLLVLLVDAVRAVFTSLSAGPPAGGQLRGEILADMVHMVQTAENCGNSAVAVHQGRRLFLRGAQADSHVPCDQRDSPVARGYGGQCPVMQVVQISRRGTEADSHGPDFGPQSFSSCSASDRCPCLQVVQVVLIPVDAQRRLLTVQTVD